MGPGQNWVTSADGGYLANPQLSRQLRRAALPIMKFAQFTRIEPGYGKNKGDAIPYNKVSRVLNQGGFISELSSMPATKISVSRDQLTVDEMGNSIPFTGKLESLSEFNPNDIIQQALKDDQAITIDTLIAVQFKKCKVKYTPTGTPDKPTGVFNTSGVVAATATRDTETFDVKAIVDYMKDTLYVPKRTDGGKEHYACIASVGFLRSIKDDDDFIDAVRYGRPEDLYTGEVGMYEGVRFIEQVNSMSSVIGVAAKYKGEALFFGADPVIEGMAIPPEIRAKIPTDYGRNKGIAWYGIGGWKLAWETANPGEANVVHVTSV
jgi:N4-gp56 family major capsid protein